MKDKFFKFLKDNRAYDAWLSSLKSNRSESFDEFLIDTSPESYISGAFTWNSYNFPDIDWCKLSNEWRIFYRK